MEFLPLSFIAGILTILAPCVLPLLPVIIGGSLTEKDSKRPIIITASLAISIVLFTLLLKASTLLVDIPQDFWKYFSGGIVLIFAFSLLFPFTWAKFVAKISSGKLEHKSQGVIAKFHQRKGFWPAVVIGMALGPVFASCSPTYFLILGTVLPANIFVGIINLFVYAIGLSLVMLIVAFASAKALSRVNTLSDPNGWFKKSLGVLFLIVAVGIISGYDKKFEGYILEKGFFDITKVEQGILDSFENEMNDKKENNLDAQNLLNANYKAPEFKGLENWINSEPVKSLEDLRGKVVLVDFWTYSCINCIRTLPYIQALHEKYSDKGLVVVGVHAPEFAFERKVENLKAAVDDFGLTYPVVQDNDFQTWRNYNNRYWPAKYIIDKGGNVRYTHFGEGEYEETERVVASLLESQYEGVQVDLTEVDFKQIKSPETYLGTSRRSGFAGVDTLSLRLNEWTATASWQEDSEKIFTRQLPASISMVFNSSSINLVLGGNAHARVYIDGELFKEFDVKEEKLYNLADFKGEYKEREMRVEFEGESIESFAFTFG